MTIRSLHKNLNNYNNLLLFLGVSLTLLLLKAQICNCNTSSIININIKYKICQELNYCGLSISHLLLWCLIGFLFPDKFIVSQMLGLLFELLEYIIIIQDKIMQDKILKYIGGCLYYPNNKKQKHHIIDNSLGPHSEIHWWHIKYTDIILNIIGFGIGYNLYKLYFNL